MKEKYIDKDFIRNLNKFIKMDGKRKQDIAKAIGISRQMLAQYLSGEHYPTPSTMERMCKYFNVARTDFYKE